MSVHSGLPALRNSELSALPLSGDWRWQMAGLCRDHPAEMFFPESEGRHGLRRREEQAKRICRGCPVITECREHALQTPEVYGIWGAMTACERARLE
jgi:WhiB family transcriptional regulator, redox-sensing transcriptional regulator